MAESMGPQIMIGQGQQVSQKTAQTMELSARQINALKLLQAPAAELDQAITEVLNNNPLLEIDESPGISAESGNSADQEEIDYENELVPPENPMENARPLQDLPQGTMENGSGQEELEEHLEHLAETPEDWETIYGGTEVPPVAASEYDPDSGNDAEKSREYFFNSLTAERSLQEDLLEQLRFTDAPANVRTAAEYMIGCLDENGYFTEPLAEVAQATGTSLEDAGKALDLLRTFDPPGIAAGSLSECLLLQLKAAGNRDKQLEILVKNYLEEIGRNHLPQIAEKMKISMDRLQELIGKIRRLDRHPGKEYAASCGPGIIPDVIVEPDGDDFKVTLNDTHAPKLKISETYSGLLNEPGVSAADKSYLREKIADGKLAIYELEHRSSTILRIAKLIVSEQFEFMKHGGTSLRPLTMRQAADKLGLHETTVSRGAANKYMLTPQGLFEFRHFFSTGFRAENGEEASSRSIKEMISEMIAKEDTSKPLSDEKISQLLKEKGFSVARRTVMKYRESMGIQSSQIRKTFT